MWFGDGSHAGSWFDLRQGCWIIIWWKRQELSVVLPAWRYDRLMVHWSACKYFKYSPSPWTSYHTDVEVCSVLRILRCGQVSGKCRGSQHLAGCIVVPSDEDSLTFNAIFASGETYKLRASNVRERQVKFAKYPSHQSHTVRLLKGQQWALIFDHFQFFLSCSSFLCIFFLQMLIFVNLKCSASQDWLETIQVVANLHHQKQVFLLESFQNHFLLALEFFSQ